MAALRQPLSPSTVEEESGIRVSISTLAGEEIVIIRPIGDTIRALKHSLELDRGFSQRQQRIFQRNAELEDTAELRSAHGRFVYKDVGVNHVTIDAPCAHLACCSRCFCDGCVRIRSSNDDDDAAESTRTVALELLVDETQEELHTSLRLMLVGERGVGKTATMFRYVHGDYIEQDLQGGSFSVDIDQKTKQLHTDDGHNLKLEIWCIAAGSNYHDLAMEYVRSAHGVLILYDVMDELSFEMARNLVLSVVNMRNRDPAMPFVLVGNKQDLQRAPLLSTESPPPVSAATARSFAEEHGGEFMEISAQEGANVDEVFAALATKAMEAELQRNTPGRAIDLHQGAARPPRIICEIRMCCRTETIAMPCSIL
jgi:small GTP-binding protein